MSFLAGIGEAAGLASTLSSMASSMEKGIMMSNAATMMQMKMTETETMNNMKKQIVSMLKEAAKQVQ